MTDTPSPEPSPGAPCPPADATSDARLEMQVLALVSDWLHRSREASAAHTEAAIDRGSFESFPASDPVAPAGSSTDREPGLEEIDCTMRLGLLEFRCAAHEPDASRPPPASTIEGEAPDGRRMRLRVWVDDMQAGHGVPQSLELEPVHASLRARLQERRAGADRRSLTRAMPQGFDRRVAPRRAPGDGAGPPA
jgi:hypothetical protein